MGGRPKPTPPASYPEEVADLYAELRAASGAAGKLAHRLNLAAARLVTTRKPHELDVSPLIEQVPAERAPLSDEAIADDDQQDHHITAPAEA